MFGILLRTDLWHKKDWSKDQASIYITYFQNKTTSVTFESMTQYATEQL